LSPEEAALLKASQRNWIAYRDSEREFLASLVTPDRGTMMRIITNQAMVDLVKHRVLELRAYEQPQ
jgi:uncharacterized protein YecT (DUF1311 family)